MRLREKVIILAGTGRGMGQAMARLFTQEGARIVLAARRGEIIELLAAELAAAGRPALAVTADLSRREGADQVVSAAVARFGRLDGYAALAGGYYKHLNDLEAIEEEFFDLVLQNHLKSLFHGARAALPYLKSAGRGAILTIAAGYKTRREANIAYGTAKEGVIGFTRNLARELHPHQIRVNCICPGLVRLPLEKAAVAPPDAGLGRLGRPEDIAYAALYLLSDEAAWITGQTLVIDGGDEVYAGLPYDLR